MDKNIIKKHLTERFLKEEDTPGISVTNAAKKQSAKINKDAMKDVEKQSKGYSKSLGKDDANTSKMAQNKFNYTGDFEKDYHDQMEIMNGQEMVKYDRIPNKEFTERAIEAIEGSSRMGNNSEWANVIPAQQGFTGPEFGKNLVKKIKKSAELRGEETPAVDLRGKDIQELPTQMKGDNGSKPTAYTKGVVPSRKIKESAKTTENNKPQIKETMKNILNEDNLEVKKAAKDLYTFLKNSGVQVALGNNLGFGKKIGIKNPGQAQASISYGESSISRGQTVINISLRGMKDKVKEVESHFLTSFPNLEIINGSRKEFGLYNGDMSGGEEIPNAINLNFTVKEKTTAKGGLVGNTQQNQKQQQQQQPVQESMKRLRFKNEFNGLGNALKLIPESYKVDSKVFEMTDGNETYKIRWEGNLSEGKAVVLTAADKTLVNEDITRMKQLFGYKSQDTLGLVKGKARIDENKAFGDIWNKTKTLLEGDDMDSATSHAPEAKKHVEGSVSTDKKTVAKASEGDWEEIDLNAPEATEHVEGSVASDKKTQATSKEGDWEKIKKKSADSTKAIENGKPTSMATDTAKVVSENQFGHDADDEDKQRQLKQGKWQKTDDGVEHQMVQNKWQKTDDGVEHQMIQKEGIDDEEDDTSDNSWYKGDDDDSSIEKEPTKGELKGDVPSLDTDDDDDEEEVIITPKKSDMSLMMSPSSGDYFIVDATGARTKVPSEYLEIATNKSLGNGAKRAEMIMAKMGEDSDNM